MTTLTVFITLAIIIILISQQQTINELEQEKQAIIELYLQSKERELQRMDKDLNRVEREMRNLHG